MLTCGFFDSIKADRKYYPHQLTDLFSMVMPNGICSSIGNGFACKAKDAHTVIVRSGLCFVNGYYAYNDDDIEFTVPEDVYPAPGLIGISVEQPPYQTEYPSGNNIDLDGIIVSGLKLNISSVTSISVTTPPQSDYPYGNNLDLGDIRVLGELEVHDDEEIRVGDCYIVLELDEENRTFGLKAINTNDYRSEIHQVLAVCHKNASGVLVENVVGRTYNNIITPTKWITGLFQSILIDDIYDDIQHDEESFASTFNTEKTAYWDAWLDNNEYCLYHQDGSTQYSRLTNELTTKQNKSIIVKDTIPKDTTEASIYVQDLPADAIVSFKNDPYGLLVKDLYVYGNYIRVRYEKTTRNYSVCLVIR